jgi:Serine/Threonine/Tyrosine Kinase found in polyvalent proteins
LQLQNEIKNELQLILSGKSKVMHGTAIQTVASYIAASQAANPMAATDKYIKTEETKKLVEYIDANNLWIRSIDEANYVSQGAEQKVYLQDSQTVFKLNDAIYYATWYDYFINLLLNNYFFSDTAYKLVGFYLSTDKSVYAVVEQPFVTATEKTNNEAVIQFMAANGFINTKNHDYYNAALNIILEDLHDQNVITQNGILYFIDTVFYFKEIL